MYKAIPTTQMLYLPTIRANKEANMQTINLSMPFQNAMNSFSVLHIHKINKDGELQLQYFKLLMPYYLP